MHSKHIRSQKKNAQTIERINRILRQVGADVLRPDEEARALLAFRNVDEETSSARVPTVISLTSALVAFLAIGFSSNADIPVHLYVMAGIVFFLVTLNSSRDVFAGNRRFAGKAALEVVTSRLSEGPGERHEGAKHGGPILTTREQRRTREPKDARNAPIVAGPTESASD